MSEAIELRLRVEALEVKLVQLLSHLRRSALIDPDEFEHLLDAVNDERNHALEKLHLGGDAS